MCKDCVLAFDEFWPELPHDDRMTFLWSCTAYPMGSNTRPELVYFLNKCGKNLGAMLALADAEMSAQFDSINSHGATAYWMRRKRRKRAA